MSATDGPWSCGHDGGVRGAAVPPGRTGLKPTHSRSIAAPDSSHDGRGPLPAGCAAMR